MSELVEQETTTACEPKPYSIFLAFPTAGNIKPCAHDAILQATLKGLTVNYACDQFGDVCHNFNQLWCKALMGRQAGITHFAMLHED